jgi:hypothetical protein
MKIGLLYSTLLCSTLLAQSSNVTVLCVPTSGRLIYTLQLDSLLTTPRHVTAAVYQERPNLMQNVSGVQCTPTLDAVPLVRFG